MPLSEDRDIARLFGEMGDSVRAVQRQWDALVAQVTEAIERHCVQRDELGKTIAEGFRRLDSALEKSEVIGQYGWTIPFAATPGEAITIINSISDEESADAAFRTYFTTNENWRLDQLLDKIIASRVLLFWMPALEEAIYCLRQGKYRACTSTLLPILDGVCARQFSLPEFWRARRRNELLARLRGEAVSQHSITRASMIALVGFIETIFLGVDFSNVDVRPSVLNRHLILHGREIPEARLEDCLRLLLALDTITEITE